tara:strand:+ start:385 stop:633 length:249 start_codon:yes stop_codon:yes gene_type:complete
MIRYLGAVMQTINIFKENKNILVNSGCIILCGLFFYLDWITQLGYAAGAPYVIVVMLATALNAKNKVLIYAGLSTLLIMGLS